MALLNYRIDMGRVVDAIKYVFDEHCKELSLNADCTYPFIMKADLIFRNFGKEILDLLGVSMINPFEWAEHMSLEIIDENGPKIVCYKSVHKIYSLDPEAIPKFYSNFECAPKVIYYVGKNVYPDDFNSSPLMECASGLHASTLDYAKKYGCVWNDRAILELVVDPKKCIVPYHTSFKPYQHALELTPANKFRFSECFVRKAMIE